MRRTKNGILIPDVPIMGAGKLPNAVKGASVGGENWNKMGGYLESTSRLQQIDLLLPITEYIAEIKCSMISSITNASFFGCLKNSERSFLRQSPDSATILQAVETQSQQTVAQTSIALNQVYDITYECISGNCRLLLDGNLVGSNALNVDSKNTLYIFNAWYWGDQNHALGGMIRLYSLVIKSANGDVLRDMWPAYTSESTPALYDYISNLFYVNTGEGELICSYLL